MDFTIDVGSLPYRDDLTAEVRWAPDGYAEIAWAPETGRFCVRLYSTGKPPVTLDLDALQAALAAGRERLRAFYPEAE